MKQKFFAILIVTFIMMFFGMSVGYGRIRFRDMTSQIHFGNDSTERECDSVNIIVIHSNYFLGEDSMNVDSCIMQFRQHDVASHYLINRDGEIIRLVDEKFTAWHAGPSSLAEHPEYTSINRASIGIEMINTINTPPTEAQYKALIVLIRNLQLHYPICYIVGHSDIANTRKSDPWCFNWKKLEQFCPYGR